ncbi:MAG: hypothetical protein ACOH5I_03170 [Oligoflexus sp.]
MTPQEAKELLQKLDRLNAEIDALDRKMSAICQNGKAEENDRQQEKAKHPALNELKEKLGADFIKRSFW